MGFNNDGYRRGGQARLEPRAAARRRRHQYRPEQGLARPHRRLCRRDRDVRGSAPIISRSTFPRPTRRACAICTRATNSTSSRAAVLAARDRASPRRPTLVKISPDLDEPALEDVLAVALARRRSMGYRRQHVRRPADDADVSPRRSETGGLSGRPIFELSTRLAGALLPALRPRTADHRRRRRGECRDRARQDRGGREPHPDLHRIHLSRAGSCRRDPAWPRRASLPGAGSTSLSECAGARAEEMAAGAL